MRRTRKQENPPTISEPDTSGEECIYVHNPEEGVTLPPHPSKIYAVIDVKGHQHKVTKDDRVILEKLIPTDPDEPAPEIGQQIVFDKVLIVGTQDYTSIGRPTVPHARVYATLEEKTRSEKVIIFKKKRRKGYQKSQGHK